MPRRKIDRPLRAQRPPLLLHGETDAENLTYYEYDEANELTGLHDVDGWTYFAYDENGNTVAEQTPAHTRYYDWDGRDMLVGVRSTEQVWTDNEYRYDGMASRMSTLESTGFTYYDWDGISVVQEKTGAGTVTDRQVHGYAPIFSVGDIAHMDKAGTPYVPLSDQVGTIWNLLNASAAKANYYTYDAFGVARSVSQAVGNLYRFGTKRLHTDAALYHFVARPYLPRIGRFAIRDTSTRLAVNRAGYVYAASAPLTFVDPTGLTALQGTVRFFRDLGGGGPEETTMGSSTFQAIAYGSAATGMFDCCPQVDIVQIARQESENAFWPGLRVWDWHVDRGVPYPRTEKHLADRPPSIIWRDEPGATYWVGRPFIPVVGGTVRLRQDWVSCVVCTVWGDMCGRLLGCVRWGHEWKYWNLYGWGLPLSGWVRTRWVGGNVFAELTRPLSIELTQDWAPLVRDVAGARIKKDLCTWH